MNPPGNFPRRGGDNFGEVEVGATPDCPETGLERNGEDASQACIDDGFASRLDLVQGVT